MVSAGVCWNDDTKIVFLDLKTSKVNQKVSFLNYKKCFPHVTNFVLKVTLFCDKTVLLCTRDVQPKILLIDQGVDFIVKDDWPPQSPDLNPMDYAMWGSFAEFYMGRSIPFTKIALKAKMKECWRLIGIEEVRRLIASWR
ncbi:hypothetical protein ElyMa_004609500 [Elysia marginata]|uniref:Uncharacterized protein n=1 Tax=Elysia marginata TaxID=1093978 RepID=A0AAV4I0Q6_9GAST|nr:hypothetical protein ElyMa_004609500 [Elysia marginata]